MGSSSSSNSDESDDGNLSKLKQIKENLFQDVDQNLNEKTVKLFVAKIQALADDAWGSCFPAPPDLLEGAKEGNLRQSPWAAQTNTYTSIVLHLLNCDSEGRLAGAPVLTGSLAKKTAVDPHMSDIDLVLEFKNFEPTEAFLNEQLSWVEEQLKKGDLPGKISRRGFYFRLEKPVASVRQVYGYGEESAQAEVAAEDNTFAKKEAKYIHIEANPVAHRSSVDILIGGKFLSISQHFHAGNTDEWVYWAATCSHTCVEFVSSQGPDVLTAIRALKAWRDTLGIKKGRFKPSSFLLELICIKANELHLHKKDSPNPKEIFTEALVILQKPFDDIDIKWTKHYPLEAVSDHIRQQRPLVLDPTNPTNNVVRQSNLERIQGPARDLLAHLR
jgi:hypothetical protein